MQSGVRGRPRSEETRRAILDAARDLILESGYPALSIQAIAARAGSGRQTVYRWWRSKAHLVADLVVAGKVELASPALLDTGQLSADLATWLDAVIASLDDPSTKSLMLALVTAASDDPDEARLLYEITTGPLHDALVTRLAHGKGDGQLAGDVDERAIADALIGSVLFRALTSGASPAPAAAVIHALVGVPSPSEGSE